MASHPAWKGYLRVSLVSIPLRAVSASNGEAQAIRFNQLHQPCKSRIRYKKTCPIHGEVPNDEIVSGYEFAKNQYVVIDPDEVGKLRPEGDKSLSLEAFVPSDAIDPLYLAGQAWFLLPEGEVGQKAYALVQEALAAEKLQGIGTVVISKRERLVRVRPLGNLLAMELLHHDAEVKRPEAFDDELKAGKSTAQELKLTRSLLTAMTQKDFNPADYPDEYADKLHQLIEAKVEGHEVASPESLEVRPVVNLMDALTASMKRVNVPKLAASKSPSPKRPRGKPARKATPTAAARKTTGKRHTA